MLYERWRQMARERRGELALRELASGRRWTFDELARSVEGSPPAAGVVAFPQGHSADFVLAVLRAWRANAVVCPLEPDQTPPAVPPPPRPCVHLKMTSATTGAPRVIAFTAAQLAADAENIVATMGLRPDWPNLAAISMAHSYGFSNLVTPLLLHGIPLVIAPAPFPEAVRRAGADVPALTLPAVPAMWRAWHAADAIPRSVRLAISAGAPLPLALERAVHARHGCKLHNFYGSSECGGIAYDAAETLRADEAGIGAPLRNVTLTVNADGCLVVQSRAVGETYWPEPMETLAGGRFETSDLAEITDGLVHLRGRRSDLINVAGRKVSPAEIERVLREHEAVRECLVFGVPAGDAGRADIVAACVVAATPVTVESLRRFLLGRLPAWQVPRAWRFPRSLDANARGKISRAEWRRRLLREANPHRGAP